MFQQILTNSRFLILIAVLCSFMAAIVVLLGGAIQTFAAVEHFFTHGLGPSKEAKMLVLPLIEAIDLFLLATVFYITALGLYELFIDDRITVPSWLEIHTIDDLKSKLTSVVVVILSVIFLGQAVQWNGQTNLLPFGSSIALVIAALTYFLSQKNRKLKHRKRYPTALSSHSSADTE